MGPKMLTITTNSTEEVLRKRIHTTPLETQLRELVLVLGCLVLLNMSETNNKVELQGLLPWGILVPALVKLP
jgi:hypothetical protein